MKQIKILSGLLLLLFISFLPVQLFAEQKKPDLQRDRVVTRWAEKDGKKPGTYQEWKDKHPDRPYKIKKVIKTKKKIRPPSTQGSVSTSSSSGSDALVAGGVLPPSAPQDYGTFYIFVNSDVYSNIESSLNQYVSDLEQRYSKVVVFSGTFDTAVHMRQYMQNAYTNDGMVGCLFVGDFPVPWFEISNQPPGFPSSEQFPCDMFYMDMNGTWSDSNANGIYDVWSEADNETLEIYMGRLTASELCAGNLTAESALYNNYFAKAHTYRINGFSIPHRALNYIMPDWAWGSKYGLDIAYTDSTLVEGVNCTGAGYRLKLTEGYEYVYLMAHSASNFHQLPGSSVYSSELAGLDPHVLFYQLFCCSNARYTDPGCMGASYIFTPTYTLGAMGSTKTGSILYEPYFFTPLKENKNFGEAFKLWTEYLLYPAWHYGMTYMGDPSLKIANPGLKATAWINDAMPGSGGSFDISWAGHVQGFANIQTYDVQFSDNGGAWTDWKINTSALSANFSSVVAGHTYSFRCRAKDYTGTIGDYSASVNFDGRFPAVSGITPSAMLTTSALTISIMGSNYFGGGSSSLVTSIKLDDEAKTSLAGYSVLTDSSIRNAVIPSGVLAGTYNVRVTTSCGTNVTSAVKISVTNPPVDATFAATDTSTQGNWKGVYGADGYKIIMDSSSIPAYATVTTNSGASSCLWDGAPSDQRTLQRAASGRISACWYGNDFDIEINITDGNTHKVAAYFMDWDGGNTRVTSVTILNYSDNSFLDTRTVSSYQNGKYLVWNISGHVIMRFHAVNYNATISGLFFDSSVVGNLPVVSTVTAAPAGGSNLNSSTLSITGSYFTGLTQVKLTGSSTVTLTGANAISDSIINNAIVPAGIKAGTYDVIVTTNTGSNVSSTGKYVATTPAPAVTVIAPNSATFGPAVTVNLTGTNFFSGLASSNISAVKLYPGGSTLTGYVPVSTTSITGVIIPVNTFTGVYTIKATSYDGGEGAGVTYTVSAPAPVVTNITPTYGVNTVGATITIIGSGYYGGNGSASVTQIRLDDGSNTAFTGFTVVSDTQIRNAIIPSGAAVGTYNIKVTTNGGTNAVSAVKYESQPGGVAPRIVSSKAGPDGIFITFDLSMEQTATETRANYTLTSPTGTTLASNVATFTYDSPLKTLRISGLTLGATYSVTATSGVSSTSLVALDPSFRTTSGSTDTTLPTGSNSINSGAAFTGGTTVTLTLSASDANGISLMMFNTGSGWTSAEAYSASKVLTLSAGDGTKTVSARFKDSVGNWTGDINDTIILDTTAPTGSVSISSGATYTSNVTTTLSISATDTYSSVVSMRFSNDGTAWGTAQAYASSSAQTITAGDGVKTVYVQFLDGAGNWSGSCTDTITLDTAIPTGSFTINGGAARINSAIVTLAFSYADAGSGVTNIRYQGNGSSWLTTSATGTGLCTTTAGDGIKTLVVGYKDGAGNWSTPITNSTNLCTVAFFKVEGPVSGRVLSGTAFTIKASAMIDATTPTTAFTYTGKYTTTDLTVASIPEKIFSTGTATMTITLNTSGKQRITVSDKNIPTVTGIITLKVFGYQSAVGTTGATITNSSGVRIDIPAGVISSGMETIGFASTENPIAPRISYIYKNTLNPISYDFGILDIATMTLKSVTYDKPVKITIPYDMDDVGAGIEEQELRIFYYNPLTSEYELVKGAQTVANGTVSCQVAHFSTYRILGTNYDSTLDNVTAYPNPFVANGTKKIKFINMPKDCQLYIYNVAGEKAIELNEADMPSGNTGYIEWDGKNTAEEPVAKGVYIYVIKSANGLKKTGKIILTK